MEDNNDNKNRVNGMKDIFFFDSMITPKIITGLYWLLLAATFLGFLGLLVGDAVGPALLTLIFGTLGARVWCELMIVLFKINENIQRIADKS